jgi:hypothetical protein
VGVIPFRRSETPYSVYSFIGDDGNTVLEQWFDDNEIPDVVWGSIYAFWDIYKSGGLLSIRASMIDLGDGFFGLMCSRKGSILACPIFCSGPFDEETEITIMTGAQWDDRKKRVRPYSAVGTAEENLEVLLQKPHRRRRERGT